MRRLTALIAFVLLSALPSHAFEGIKFKAEMRLPGNMKPGGMAVDAKGNIYLTDKASKSIQVLSPDAKPLRSFRGKESKSGKPVLKEPHAIALDGEMLYVTDTSAHRVAVFKTDGTFVAAFGKHGSKPKEFRSPGGISVADGIIYVADTGNNRVQMLSLDGIFLATFGERGDEPTNYKKPTSIAVDHRGFIYAADSGNSRVQIIKPSGQHHRNITNFKRPEVLLMDTDGFFTADNRTRQIRKYGFRGKLLLSFGTKGAGRAQFKRIQGLALGPAGDLYVLDGENRSIQVFSIERKDYDASLETAPPPTSVRWHDRIGINASQILWARGTLYALNKDNGSVSLIRDGKTVKTIQSISRAGGMAVDAEGSIWLTEPRKKRIVKLTDEGGVAFTIEGYFSEPTAIVVSPKGIVYVADAGKRSVLTFNTDGIFIASMGVSRGRKVLKKPVALALDSSDNLYVVDEGNHAVFKFNKEGRPKVRIGVYKGKGVGEFTLPRDVAVLGGELYVLDSGNRRVQVFTRQGRFLRQFGTKGPDRGDFDDPVSLTLMDSTTVLVNDPGKGGIQVFKTIHSPRTPANLKARGGKRRVSLTWSRGMDEYIDHYRIYRSENRKRGYEKIASVTKNRHTDINVQPNIAYYYRVSAVATSGNESRKSRAVEVRAQHYIPEAVSGLNADSQEGYINIDWRPIEDALIASYAVYREEDGITTLLGKAAKPPYSDSAVKPNTIYTYKVAAVSLAGAEGAPAEVKVRSLSFTRPPIEISVLNMNDIFSNNYKIYESEPIGTVRITNNVWETISALKVAFRVKRVMDFPTEMVIQSIRSNQSVDVELNAIFNEDILGITENTPVQAEIRVSYYENEQLRSFVRNYPLMIYERHHLTWDERDKLATFITPKDPVVLEFSRGVAVQYKDIAEPMLYARAIFDAMGVYGLSFIQDPNNPYQMTSGQVDFIDYIQYPRETLRRKSGDCDDLVSLYSAALESIGIETALLDYPGHILMMFSTGIAPDSGAGDKVSNYIQHEGRLWIPIETTLVGKSFTSAWKQGLKDYYRWKDSGLQIITNKEAWKRFKPATLPPTGWRAAPVRRRAIEARFGGELQILKKQRIKYLSRQYSEALEGGGSNINSMLQLGILYGENNETKSALDLFKRILVNDNKHSAALNNIGNVYYLNGRYTEATKYYEEALRLDPADPHVWVNLTRCYLKMNKHPEARKAFSRAYILNPKIPKLYPELIFELDSGP